MKRRVGNLLAAVAALGIAVVAFSASASTGNGCELGNSFNNCNDGSSNAYMRFYTQRSGIGCHLCEDAYAGTGSGTLYYRIAVTYPGQSTRVLRAALPEGSYSNTGCTQAFQHCYSIGGSSCGHDSSCD